MEQGELSDSRTEVVEGSEDCPKEGLIKQEQGQEKSQGQGGQEVYESGLLQRYRCGWWWVNSLASGGKGEGKGESGNTGSLEKAEVKNDDIHT